MPDTSDQPDIVRTYRRYLCQGYVETTLRTYAESPEIAAEIYRQEHGSLPEFVDGRIVIGECERCGVALFVGSDDVIDGDQSLCVGCGGPGPTGRRS